jgi:hypothetical protein
MPCGWYGAPRCCSTCWCTLGQWKGSVNDGASAPPVSPSGVRPACCKEWTVGPPIMGVGADRHGRLGSKNAGGTSWRPVRSGWAWRRPVGLRSSSACCSGASVASSTIARMSARGCPPWGLRCQRRAWCRTISTRPSAWPGSRRSGQRFYVRPSLAKVCSCLQRRPAWPRGAPGVLPGRAAAGSLRCSPVASAKAPGSLEPWPMALGACSLKVVKAGVPRQRPKPSWKGSWSTHSAPCFLDLERIFE